MQTFLPFPDLAASADVLDDRRLGKQRVETLQILRSLTCEGYGWANHPAVTMWRGHVPALVTYGLVVVEAWQERGYADTTAPQIAEFAHGDGGPRSPAELTAAGLLPPWWGWEALHRSHRSALLRKDRGWYGPRLPDDTTDDLDYVWPEPPAPPPATGHRDAWVVRGELTDDLLTVRLPPAPTTGRLTKAVRQRTRLTTEVTTGDTVLVPDGDGLELVTATGAARARGADHVLPVRRRGRVERTALRRPAVLQDPQQVFALRDEPAVAARHAPS